MGESEEGCAYACLALHAACLRYACLMLGLLFALLYLIPLPLIVLNKLPQILRVGS